MGNGSKYPCFGLDLGSFHPETSLKTRRPPHETGLRDGAQLAAAARRPPGGGAAQAAAGADGAALCARGREPHEPPAAVPGASWRVDVVEIRA